MRRRNYSPGSSDQLRVHAVHRRLGLGASLSTPVRAHPRAPATRDSILVFAIFSAAVLQIDVILLSRLAPGEDIATYSILAKIFSTPLLFYGAFLKAFWPAATAMFAGDCSNLLTSSRTIAVSGTSAMAVAYCVISAIAPSVVPLLAPSLTRTPEWSTIALFAVYFTVRAWTDTYSMLLQSQSHLRPLLMLVPIQALCRGNANGAFTQVRNQRHTRGTDSFVRCDRLRRLPYFFRRHTTTAAPRADISSAHP